MVAGTMPRHWHLPKHRLPAMLAGLPERCRGHPRPDLRNRQLRTRAASGNGASAEPIADLVDGAVTSGPDLSVEVNGLKLPNPFVIASGPPGTNYAVMKKAFQEGWGGVVTKTVSLDSSKVVNVTPRYAKMRGSNHKDVIGWENIELISDRPLEVMLDEFARLKKEFPNRILIASIMEEYNRVRRQRGIAPFLRL